MAGERTPLGTTLELRYEDPRVCDTWVGMVVERLVPAFVVRLLVLSDPLDEYQGEATILSTESKLREWDVTMEKASWEPG
jgi:hypothetical protein